MSKNSTSKVNKKHKKFAQLSVIKGSDIQAHREVYPDCKEENRRRAINEILKRDPNIDKYKHEIFLNNGIGVPDTLEGIKGCLNATKHVPTSNGSYIDVPDHAIRFKAIEKIWSASGFHKDKSLVNIDHSQNLTVNNSPDNQAIEKAVRALDQVSQKLKNSCRPTGKVEDAELT